MKPRFFGIMVAIVTIPSLTILTYPQLAVAQRETLSRSSSLNVENRSVSNHYQEFFETRRNIAVRPLAQVESYNLSTIDDEELRLFVNDPLVETNLLISPQRELYEGINRVEVRIEPTE